MSLMLTHPRLAGCRRLFLHDYTVPVRIGVHDFERDGPQRMRFQVDLWVPLDLGGDGVDHIDEVVDYDFIRHAVSERIAQGHIEVQETLADDLLRVLLQHPRVRAARVATAKLDVYPDAGAVGVEVFAFADDPEAPR